MLLGLDVFYLVMVSFGLGLPAWTNLTYLLTYLLIGFAALHPSSAALSEPTAEPATRPLAAKIGAMAGASLLAPVLLAWQPVAEAPGHDLAIAVGGGLCSLLVLMRFVDLLRHSESQALQLTVLARTDSLTGVPNRRSWDFQLARATDGSSAQASLTVAMIDLDNFKLYNDQHGHLAGDLALMETAAGWASILEGHGYLARYGGEEFAVLISGASREECESLLGRMHATVARGQTCSVGVSEWLPGEPVAQAVLRADESLYEAKRAGRDRVVWHVVDRPEPPQAPDPAAQPRELEPFIGA
jgi:diguanylate cyclase (GGDEF)-like protein